MPTIILSKNMGLSSAHLILLAIEAFTYCYCHYIFWIGSC